MTKEKCPKDGFPLNNCLPYVFLYCRKCGTHYRPKSDGTLEKAFGNLKEKYQDND